MKPLLEKFMNKEIWKHTTGSGIIKGAPWKYSIGSGVMNKEPWKYTTGSDVMK